MTWWGALGLALSLYGAVVALERLYSRILPWPGLVPAAITVVLYVRDQESVLERAVSDLSEIWQDAAWQRRDMEILIVDGGSSDQTLAIAKRLERRFPFITVAPSYLDKGQVLDICQHDVILWVDLTQMNPYIPLATLKSLLLQSEPVMIRSIG
ncbi:glycosyltransferase [Sulfobacillus thermosulfidooxidans]|uniref:glycosyltransferase n=1 Tax=Sulfobacillus thermosulfidooxidans TaxID=28034 RepID=UPI00040EEA43|nr:glycosyltransferase [Sulfobacillus thermosulfidooxidans]